jgi:hypothetical protein
MALPMFSTARSSVPKKISSPFADVYTYHEGDTHFTPLPLIARKPATRRNRQVMCALHGA